jgi:hypothetical protein
MKHIQTFESINEASKFTFSEAEIKNAAETLAKAMAKLDKVKVAVHDFEYDKGRGAGFELSWDGDKFDGGSYYIKPNGDVVNAAVGGGTTYGNIKSDEKEFTKGIKSSKGNMRTDESILTEGRGDQFLIIKDGKEVKGFKTWSGAKKYVESNKGYSADDIQSSEWYHDHKNESALTESGMSDMYLTATEAKDEAEFLSTFFKEYSNKVKKNPASIKWAKEIYADALEMALESAIHEASNNTKNN